MSQQTRNRARLRQWKQDVSQAARAAVPLGELPSSDDVSVIVTYYYDGSSPDVDNIIKPIQDALIGIVFIDDNQVVDTKSRKRNINGSFKIRGVSPILLAAFAEGDDFLHIRVEEAPNPEELN